MSRRPRLGRAELEVLKFVSDRHPVTVRDVADHAAETRGTVRTTVLNVMTRLCNKGYLLRKKVGGIYHYSPRVAKGDLLRSLVRDFVKEALGGSVSPFVAYLAEDADVSDDEVRQLRKLVQELEAQPARSNP